MDKLTLRKQVLVCRKTIPIQRVPLHAANFAKWCAVSVTRMSGPI